MSDPRMQDGSARYEYKDIINEAIEAWTRQHTKEEVMAIIAGAGVPCGAVFNMKEQLEDEDLHARGIMTRIDHPVRGEMTVPSSPIRMSATKVPIRPSPIHGANNEEIYGEWLGISAEEVKKMRAENVI
jgi:formyl-CoA transferase